MWREGSAARRPRTLPPLLARAGHDPGGDGDGTGHPQRHRDRAAALVASKRPPRPQVLEERRRASGPRPARTAPRRGDLVSAASPSGDALLQAWLLEQEHRGLLPHTIEKRRKCLRVLMTWLAGRSLLQVTQEDIEAFLGQRAIGPRSRYVWLSHLHVFYRWAIDQELTDKDPTVKIPRPRLRRSLPRPIATADLRAALEQSSGRHRCWILLGAYEGLRCQEMAGLRREDVLEDDELLRVVAAKGDHERVVPLHPEVAQALLALPMPEAGWIFVGRFGQPYTPNHLSQDLNAYLRSVGVTATAHQLRHWFATELYRSTHDLRLTQEMLGHSSPAMTALYTQFDRSTAGAAVAGLRATA